MEYREFIAQVQKRGKLASFEEAEATTLSVMRALSEVICRERALSMRSCLPDEIYCILEPCRPEVDPLIDMQTFIGWASADLDAVGMPDRTLGGLDLFAADAADEAVRRCGLVFCVLKSCLGSSQQEALACDLPEEVCDWFRAA
ncbi:MAG: hypothetical protein AMJ76_03085 [Dehalococcoidia bacterium SM23_28_1]|nr:MAG: hypothetical protein AMJ76_03085 [Dehalococcoidia bacterium SM23_28_1]